jgi:hypothetical protein
MDMLQGFITLLHQTHSEIRDIEARFQIYGHEGDYRPRIEYYHDAVRAYASDFDDGLTKDSRLAIERLAYDVEMLRLIADRPLSVGRGEQHFSTEDALVVQGEMGDGLTPDRRTKGRLSELYRNYGIYFIALMAEKADANIKARKEDNTILIQDCNQLEQLLNQLAANAIDLASVIKIAGQMEHDGLRRKILALLNRGKPNRDELNSAANSVKDARLYFQHDQKQLDDNGMRFASSQLMVYEANKEMIRQLSERGLNVAGKFMKQTLGEHGQGRGTTRGV